MRCLGVLTGSQFHELDHITPLAYFLEMPLVVNDERCSRLAQEFYPQIESHYMPDFDLCLSEIAKKWDALFTCKYWPSHLSHLFRTLYQKEMKCIFCPHGQSDKGYRAPLLEPMAHQDGVLLYGDLFIQMLKDLHIWPSLGPHVIVGNYRLSFYQAHQQFQDEKTKKHLFFKTNQRTVLYAPTWRDAEGETSFFSQVQKVISELPSSWNLILKTHPLLEQRDAAAFYACKELTEKKENVFFLHEFPFIYSVLALTDVYLGDFSSVGYDFLYFQKPLYFFPSSRLGRLHGCGKIIDLQKNLYMQLEKENLFQEKQKALYEFAFGPPVDAASFKTRVLQAFTD